MLAYSSIENMGILIIGLALGGIGTLASIIHLIGHSLIKASFFLTSGNILKIYSTKKIKSVSGLMQIDPKTGWLWILSFIGIAAFPPSILFISEFFLIKTMFLQNKILMAIIFFLLLTIILFGLAKAVIKMTYSTLTTDKEPEIKSNLKKLSISMYLPQIIMILLTFIIGVNIPDFISNLIDKIMVYLILINQ